MKYLTQTIPVAGYDNLFEFYIIDTEKDTKERVCGTKEFVDMMRMLQNQN